MGSFLLCVELGSCDGVLYLLEFWEQWLDLRGILKRIIIEPLQNRIVGLQLEFEWKLCAMARILLPYSIEKSRDSGYKVPSSSRCGSRDGGLEVRSSRA